MQSALSDKMVAALTVVESGIYLWNIERNSVSIDAKVSRFFDFSAAQERDGLTVESLLGGLHPADRAKAAKMLHEGILTGEPYQAECRLVRPNGSIVHVVILGKCFRNGMGVPSECTGIIFNMTVGDSSVVADTLFDVCQLAHLYAGQAQEPSVKDLLEQVLVHLRKVGRTTWSPVATGLDQQAGRLH